MDTSTFVGTGFAYLQSKLLKPISAKSNNKSFDEQSNNETASSRCISLVPDGPNLSENAKRILMQLLLQENVQLKNYRTNSVSSSIISHSMNSIDVLQQDLSKKIVTSEMSDDTILDLAYNQEISLLGSILSVIDQYPNVNLSTATTGGAGGVTSTSVSSNYILQRCALAVIPQKTPGLLSAKEMIYAALHFLCQEYPPLSKKYTDTTMITIQLPLIQSTSMSNDIERRSYEKLYDWDINSILSQILILEQYFYNAIHIDHYTISQSSSSTTTSPPITTTIASSEKKLKNPLMLLPREMFIPNKIPNELHREILVKGSIPVDTKNSAATTSTKTGTSTSTNDKAKSTSAVATTNTNTNSTTSSSSSAKKIQIKRKSQSISTTSSTKDKSESTITTTSPKPKSILKKIKITPKRKLPETDHNDTVNVTTQPEITMIQSEQLENTYGSSEAQMPQEATTTSSPNINIDVMATNVYDEDETDDDDNDDADVNDEQLLFD